MLNERIGEIIRKRRLELKMSQKELARLAGTSQGYISDLESGKKANPTIESIMSISRVLNVKSEKLIGVYEGFEEITIEGKNGVALNLDDLPLEAQIDVIKYFQYIREKYLNKP